MSKFSDSLKILLINTGGTIVSRMKPDGTYGHATLNGQDLISEINIPTNIHIETIEIFKKISYNITTIDRFSLAKAIIDHSKHYDGVLVLHGTNTLPETAFFLELFLSASCPVLLTGAMYPFGSAECDGIKNILHAFQVFQSIWPNDIQVAVIFNGKIHAPFSLYKGLDQKKLTLMSSSETLLGEIEDNGVHWRKQKLNFHRPTINFSSVRKLPWIPIYSDQEGGEKILNFILSQNPVGIVIAGFGEGFIRENLAEMIKNTQIPALRVSKIGGVCATWRKGYDDCFRIIPVGFLSPEKAQIFLSFALSVGFDIYHEKSFFH